MLNTEQIDRLGEIQSRLGFTAFTVVSVTDDSVNFHCDTCEGSCTGDCMGSCRYDCSSYCEDTCNE